VTDLLFKNEVADLCRTSESTVSDWVHRGIGIGALSIKLGRRRVWRRSDVEAYIAAQFKAAARQRKSA
jgi:predicted DNA-binding transcriptional regulator AlpA